MAATQRSVWRSHSSSPSVKSPLQHLNLSPSLSSPPNHPSLFLLLLFILHLSPLSQKSPLLFFLNSYQHSLHNSNSSSVQFRFSQPHLHSQDLCFFSPPSAASLSTPLLQPSSQASSVCACLPPSFHQMVCVKTLRLTARLIFRFFPWYYFNIGGIAQTCRNTEEGQAGGKRKLKYEKPRCIKSNYSIMQRAAVITGPFLVWFPVLLFFLNK